jgi:hypothetical protein
MIINSLFSVLMNIFEKFQIPLTTLLESCAVDVVDLTRFGHLTRDMSDEERSFLFISFLPPSHCGSINARPTPGDKNTRAKSCAGVRLCARRYPCFLRFASSNGYHKR